MWNQLVQGEVENRDNIVKWFYEYLSFIYRVYLLSTANIEHQGMVLFSESRDAEAVTYDETFAIFELEIIEWNPLVSFLFRVNKIFHKSGFYLIVFVQMNMDCWLENDHFPQLVLMILIRVK